MGWKHFLIAVALCHLTIVGLGAAIENFSLAGVSGRVLEYYASLSGAGEGYSFFAPGVDSQLGLKIKMTDARGKQNQVTLDTGYNHETDLRVGSIVEQFWSDVDDPRDFRRALAASLAGSVFGRYPAAKQVTVQIEEFKAISMADYARHVRPSWHPLYQATFEQRTSQELE